MKSQKSIPTGKVERASKFVGAGVRVGANYVKHYTQKLFDPEKDRTSLDEANADDIYQTLSQLKGSALKVAQMMSMDKNLLPTAYVDKFSQAQYSAPPLSYPLVVKTFQKHFHKSPTEVFETFSKDAVNAASIGQVHLATLKGKKLAVKVQYPGVAESISSDLKMVKPLAARLFNISETDLSHYLVEVESKLLEETDYRLEVKQSAEISEACKHIPHLAFPGYYPELSSDRIITMDWLEGIPLKEAFKSDLTQKERNTLGQALWDFYDFQIHELRKVHADPHPGNFVLTPDKKLGVLDFGCVKVIPDDYYNSYFKLLDHELLKKSDTDVDQLLTDIEFFHPLDTPEERRFLKPIFIDMTNLLSRPFHGKKFDFGDDAYFREIFEFGERLSKMKEIRNSRTARGSRHGIYVNRTYFGLYSILNELKAEVDTTTRWKR